MITLSRGDTSGRGSRGCLRSSGPADRGLPGVHRVLRRHPRQGHQRACRRADGSSGYQWPDPWLSLNPSFASGGTISELVGQGLLQPEAKDIFRLENGQRTPPAPAPAGGHRGRPNREELRADDRHRLGQEPRLHHPDRRPGPEAKAERHLPARHQGDRRLPDERPGQQPARRAGEVPRAPSDRQVSFAAVHRPGVAGEAREPSSRTRRTSCSPTT